MVLGYTYRSMALRRLILPTGISVKSLSPAKPFLNEDAIEVTGTFTRFGYLL